MVPLSPAVSAPIKALERNFATVTPKADDVLAAYQHMSVYDRTPLNAKVDSAVEHTRDWRKERITLDAAYAGERFSLYLFLPKNVKPPYQTVVFSPGARVLLLTNSKSLGDTAYFDYVVQRGRAVLYPVYQGTYERRFRRGLPGANQMIDLSIQDSSKQHVVLETPHDVLALRLALVSAVLGWLDRHLGTVR